MIDNNNDLKIRYLTEKECLRLMGFKDPEINKIITSVPSKTQCYKMAGNSIVVDCLEDIFKNMFINPTFKKSEPKQTRLFE